MALSRQTARQAYQQSVADLRAEMRMRQEARTLEYDNKVLQLTSAMRDAKMMRESLKTEAEDARLQIEQRYSSAMSQIEDTRNSIKDQKFAGLQEALGITSAAVEGADNVFSQVLDATEQYAASLDEQERRRAAGELTTSAALSATSSAARARRASSLNDAANALVSLTQSRNEATGDATAELGYAERISQLVRDMTNERARADTRQVNENASLIRKERNINEERIEDTLAQNLRELKRAQNALKQNQRNNRRDYANSSRDLSKEMRLRQGQLKSQEAELRRAENRAYMEDRAARIAANPQSRLITPTSSRNRPSRSIIQNVPQPVVSSSQNVFRSQREPSRPTSTLRTPSYSVQEARQILGMDNAPNTSKQKQQPKRK